MDLVKLYESLQKVRFFEQFWDACIVIKRHFEIINLLTQIVLICAVCELQKINNRYESLGMGCLWLFTTYPEINCRRYS